MKKVFVIIIAVCLAAAAFFAGRLTAAPSWQRGETTVSTARPSGAAGAAFLVNINLAGADELCELPGIGPATAQKIIEYRDTHGPFGSPEEIKAVQGIGESLFASIEKYITVK